MLILHPVGSAAPVPLKSVVTGPVIKIWALDTMGRAIQRETNTKTVRNTRENRVAATCWRLMIIEAMAGIWLIKGVRSTHVLQTRALTKVTTYLQIHSYQLLLLTHTSFLANF